MKVLCVAEKPSIAKSITEILSGGRWDTVSLLFLHPILPHLPSILLFILFYCRSADHDSENLAINMYETTTLATTYLLHLVIEGIPILQ
jgi:DNA topoisomerase IA